MTHRLLLLDDEASVLFAISRYFVQLGFEVDCACEMEEAEALLLGRGGYSLIIADLSLASSTGMEGLEFVRFARHHAPLTPIMMLTAHGSVEVEEEARRRGVDVFLQKPKPLSEIACSAARLMDVEATVES